MYLGLDLRGGVHFLMEVDMRAALTSSRWTRGQATRAMPAARKEYPPRRHHAKDPTGLSIALPRCGHRAAGRELLADQMADMEWVTGRRPKACAWSAA
jgi:preprotein translocase subunit SecD